MHHYVVNDKYMFKYKKNKIFVLNIYFFAIISILSFKWLLFLHKPP